MNPKEKAQELFNKMYEFAIFDEGAKHCALIAIDEIMKEGINSYDKMYWEEIYYKEKYQTK